MAVIKSGFAKSCTVPLVSFRLAYRENLLTKSQQTSGADDAMSETAPASLTQLAGKQHLADVPRMPLGCSKCARSCMSTLD